MKTIEPKKWTPLWIAVPDFCERFKVSDAAVYTSAKVGISKIKVKHGKIDLGYLRAVRRVREDMWNRAHDNYYILSYNHKMKDRTIAKAIAKDMGRSVDSWQTFFITGMWSRIDTLGILNTQISDALSDFVEWSDKYIEELKDGTKIGT